MEAKLIGMGFEMVKEQVYGDDSLATREVTMRSPGGYSLWGKEVLEVCYIHYPFASKDYITTIWYNFSFRDDSAATRFLQAQFPGAEKTLEIHVENHDSYVINRSFKLDKAGIYQCLRYESVMPVGPVIGGLGFFAPMPELRWLAEMEARSGE